MIASAKPNTEQTLTMVATEFVAARNPKRQSAIRPGVEDRGEKERQEVRCL